LLAGVEGNAVVLEPRSATIGRVQALVRASVAAKTKLLAEGKVAARRERRAWAHRLCARSTPPRSSRC